MHFFATRLTRSLARLAAKMERVAAFDFEAPVDTGRSGRLLSVSAASLGSEADMDAGGGAEEEEEPVWAWRWVQATSLLTEVAAIGRSFALMSLNLRSFERSVRAARGDAGRPQPRGETGRHCSA